MFDLFNLHLGMCVNETIIISPFRNIFTHVKFHIPLNQSYFAGINRRKKKLFEEKSLSSELKVSFSKEIFQIVSQKNNIKRTY